MSSSQDVVVVLKADRVVDTPKEDESKTSNKVLIKECKCNSNDIYKKAAENGLQVPESSNFVSDLDNAFTEKLVHTVVSEAEECCCRKLVVIDITKFPEVSVRVDTTDFEESPPKFQDQKFTDDFMNAWKTKYNDHALTLIQSPKSLNLKLVDFRSAYLHASYNL